MIDDGNNLTRVKAVAMDQMESGLDLATPVALSSNRLQCAFLSQNISLSSHYSPRMASRVL